MGAGIDPESIKENNDVYFECNVKANPRAYKILWKHNVSILFLFFLTIVIGKK